MWYGKVAHAERVLDPLVLVRLRGQTSRANVMYALPEGQGTALFVYARVRLMMHEPGAGLRPRTVLRGEGLWLRLAVPQRSGTAFNVHHFRSCSDSLCFDVLLPVFNGEIG